MRSLGVRSSTRSWDLRDSACLAGLPMSRVLGVTGGFGVVDEWRVVLKSLIAALLNLRVVNVGATSD